MITSIKDLAGNDWRVDRQTPAAHNHVQLNLSPVGSTQRNQRALTVPRWIARMAIEGKIRVQVRGES